MSATTSNAPVPDPFAPFRRDHARLLEQLDQLERGAFGAAAAPDPAPLRALVPVLERQFATHMAAEDAVLYPAMAAALPACRTTLEPLAADHLELRLMLATLGQRLAEAASPVRDEQVRVLARDLVDLLRLHIHREEAAVFDLAARVLSPAESRELARRVAPYLQASSVPPP